MSAVAKISGRPLDAPAQEAPALGFSLQIDLGAGRVATMQTFLPNSCDITELNAMLDKMTRAGDRQRAHYKIEELKLQLQRENDFINQAKDDLARIDGEHDKTQAQRHADMQMFQKQIDAAMELARDNHVGSGRRSEFAPKGTTKSAVDAGKNAVKKIVTDIATAENEREKAHQNLRTTISGRLALKAKIEAEMAECELIVAQGRVG